MKSSAQFFLPLIILTVLLVGCYRFYHYVIKMDFVLQVNTTCDPNFENCFNASEELSFGQTPYKKVEITARYAPKCLEEHSCESFICPFIPVGEGICAVTYCADDTKVDGEECVVPTSKNL